MPTTTDEEETFKYDAEAAERGWRATASLREAIGPSILHSVDLPDVSILGLLVSRRLLKPDVRGRFEKIDPELFDHALLDRIEPASWAVWYASNRRLSLEATESGGRVRAATLEQALGIKSRMMRVCEYMLVDDPKAGREIASIRSGTGHKDLAADLSRLATLYEGHAELLASGGGQHYDPADATTAKATAGTLLFEIGEGEAKALQEAKQDAARAFAVLQHAYDKVRRWAGAIWDDDDYLPSLFSVRPTRGPQRTTTATDTNSTETT